MRKPPVSVLLIAFVAGCGNDFDDRPPPDSDSGSAGSGGVGGFQSSGGSSGAVSAGGSSTGGSSGAGAGGIDLDASAQGGASGQGGSSIDAGPEAAPDAAACSAGYADCDKSAPNGCETSTQDNPLHCGGCNKVCPDRPHADTVCSAGTCSFTCQALWDDCDKVPNNGCEADLGSIQHCGACGKQCSTDHGQASCSAGACAIACDSGWGNCDGSSSNGCERTWTRSTPIGAMGPQAPGASGSWPKLGAITLPSRSPTITRIK